MVYAELYPLLHGNLLAWGGLGEITLPGVLYVNPWIVIIVLGVIYWVILRGFEKKGL